VNAASWFPRWLPPESVALFAVLLLLIIAVPAMGALVAARLRSVEDTPARKRARYARTMVVLWTMTGLAYYALLLHGETPADIGFKPPSSPIWYIAGPLVPLIILNIRPSQRGPISEEYGRRVRLVIPLNAGEWVWFAGVAVSAGVCEEFLYRGYALNQIAALAQSLSAGVIFSSLAFGLGHAYQGRIGIVIIAITGLLYCGLFIASGSLLPCMIAHVVQDLVGGVVWSRRLSPTSAVGSQGMPGE